MICLFVGVEEGKLSEGKEASVSTNASKLESLTSV